MLTHPPATRSLANALRVSGEKEGLHVNRQYKRMMKKEEERKKGGARPPVKAPGAATKRERTKPRQFIKEVGAELGKVAWPSRQELWAYSLVVLISSVVIAALIFGMDYVFTRAVLFLYGIEI